MKDLQARNVSVIVSLGQTHDVRKSLLQEGFFRKMQNYSYLLSKSPDPDAPLEYDVGVIRLETPFDLGPKTNIYPACLLNRTDFLSNGTRLLLGIVSFKFI